MIKAKLNQPVPPLIVSDWVQGEPVNFEQLVGHVVLLEVFQVNCPGCFLHALPHAIEIYQHYSEQGLIVLGVATAFEDFDKNTLDNLLSLVNEGIVIGETQRNLSEKGLLLEDQFLPYQIPFPLAMDQLIKRHAEVNQAEIEAFIRDRLPQFDEQSEAFQIRLQQQVGDYLRKMEYYPQTFDSYGLQGTPSQLLIDKQGVLRESKFGNYPDLEKRVQKLLSE